jgi:hypothetical protein
MMLLLAVIPAERCCMLHAMLTAAYGRYARARGAAMQLCAMRGGAGRPRPAATMAWRLLQWQPSFQLEAGRRLAST